MHDRSHMKPVRGRRNHLAEQTDLFDTSGYRPPEVLTETRRDLTGGAARQPVVLPAEWANAALRRQLRSAASLHVGGME
jgi:hypothetical protein